MTRLAMVDSPGHACFPQRQKMYETAVLPPWNLFRDISVGEELTESLHNHGINEIFYRALCLRM